MIRNERQYRATLRQRRQLADTLDELTGRSDVLAEAGAEDERGALVLDLQRASLAGQIADLDAQLSEYDELQAGQHCEVND